MNKFEFKPLFIEILDKLDDGFLNSPKTEAVSPPAKEGRGRVMSLSPTNSPKNNYANKLSNERWEKITENINEEECVSFGMADETYNLCVSRETPRLYVFRRESDDKIMGFPQSSWELANAELHRVIHEEFHLRDPNVSREQSHPGTRSTTQ